ncbi:MAG: hypothetical protein ACE5I2_13735, partial [Anaerolineae bacterium]
KAEGFFCFNPLFIGSGFLTQQFDALDVPDIKFQSPIHRVWVFNRSKICPYFRPFSPALARFRSFVPTSRVSHFSPPFGPKFSPSEKKETRQFAPSRPFSPSYALSEHHTALRRF